MSCSFDLKATMASPSSFFGWGLSDCFVFAAQSCCPPATGPPLLLSALFRADRVSGGNSMAARAGLCGWGEESRALFDPGLLWVLVSAACWAGCPVSEPADGRDWAGVAWAGAAGLVAGANGTVRCRTTGACLPDVPGRPVGCERAAVVGPETAGAGLLAGVDGPFCCPRVAAGWPDVPEGIVGRERGAVLRSETDGVDLPVGADGTICCRATRAGLSAISGVGALDDGCPWAP